MFAVLMLATFGIWQASEKTLSIHSIHTVKREAFYWTAILFTFALGTAAGDLIAEKSNLGYGKSVAALRRAHLRGRDPRTGASSSTRSSGSGPRTC